MPTLQLIALSDALVRILVVGGVVVALIALATSVMGVLVDGRRSEGRHARTASGNQQRVMTTALVDVGARHAQAFMDTEDRSPGGALTTSRG